MDESGLANDVAQAAAGGFSLGSGFFAVRWLVQIVTRWSERREARDYRRGAAVYGLHHRQLDARSMSAQGAAAGTLWGEVGR